MAKSYRGNNPLDKMEGKTPQDVRMVLSPTEDNLAPAEKKTKSKQKKTESNPKQQTKKSEPKQQNKQPAPTKNPKVPKKVTRIKKDGTKAKSNAGRPITKTEPTHTTNVDIPQELFDKFQKYKQAMGGTMTAYVNRLIRKDLEANEDLYKQITEMMIQ